MNFWELLALPRPTAGFWCWKENCGSRDDRAAASITRSANSRTHRNTSGSIGVGRIEQAPIAEIHFGGIRRIVVGRLGKSGERTAAESPA